MKKLLLAVLGGAMAACQHSAATDVALTHQHDQQYQRQVKLLQAEEVTLSGGSAGPQAPALRVLTLAVRNPANDPAHPDTLRQRARKLARLVVADLAQPQLYQVVNVQVTFKPGLFARRNPNDDGSQSFIYPVASLR